MLQPQILLDAERHAKVTPTDYFVTFLMMIFSGNPLFSSKLSNFIVLAVIVLILLVQRKFGISKYAMCVVAYFALLLALQYVMLPITSTLADINFIVRLLGAYFLIRYFGVKFRPAYFNFMFFICFVSLFGYMVTMASGSLPFCIKSGRNLSWIIYNMNVGSVRNSGMFWEPGAFQGYINMAFLLYLNELGYLWKHQTKKVIIMVIALITTMSTTGYIAFAFILGAFFMGTSSNRHIKLLLMPILLGASYYAYHQFDFLGEKIEEQLEDMENMEEGEADWSRTGSMVIDIENVNRNPLIGNGFDIDQRYLGLGELMSGGGNGLTIMLNTVGYPSMLLLLILIGYRQRTLTLFMRVCFVFGVMLLLFGENFLGYIMFTTLIFYGDYVRRVKNKEQAPALSSASFVPHAAT